MTPIQQSGSSSPPPPTDDLQRMLDFVKGQADAEITNIERLFNRAKTMFGWVLTAAGLVVVFFGITTYSNLQTLVTNLVNDGFKKQVPKQIEEQLQKKDIETIVKRLIEQKTNADFRPAIDNAVAIQLDTPQRQKLLEAAVQHQVDGWFAKHPAVIQAAAQKQVDILTEQLQGSVKILQLGAAAVTPSSKSGPALRSLRDLATNSPNNSFKELANAQLNIAAGYWGAGNSFIGFSKQIKSLDEKGEKFPYKTCDLLALLGSPSWEDRSRAAYFFTLSPRLEKGVPEALLHAMSDEYLEVAFRAGKALAMMTGREGIQHTFPEVSEFQKWWKTEGEPGIAPKLKPLECK